MLDRKARLRLRPAASGFTLVELLVVIAIIGILIGMLLPAVQQVREAARRTSCMNKTRQMALAALNFESAFNRFPGGAEHINADLMMLANDSSSNGWGWRSKILPFMEQQNLFDSIDFTTRINSGTNPVVLETPVESFICPANPELLELRHPVAGIQMAMCRYLGNGGSIEDSFQQPQAFSDGILMRSLDDRHEGIELGQIEDGLSNTFFCGETIAYAPLVIDRFGSFIWDPAMYAATNNSGTAARTLGQVRTGHGELNPEWIRPDLSNLEIQSLLRNSYASNHSGGAVFVFVDGSTHFINDNIDHNRITETDWAAGVERGTYQRLFSRNDGLILGDF